MQIQTKSDIPPVVTFPLTTLEHNCFSATSWAQRRLWSIGLLNFLVEIRTFDIGFGIVLLLTSHSFHVRSVRLAVLLYMS